ncbi:MAG: murein hydrolase activator EnvC family protein [Paracoccaceae bacterium]
MIRVLALLLLAAPALADTPMAAREAARRLEDATALLEAARGAEDRVAALTETVRAFEQGLGTLRDGLRRAAVRRRTIEAQLDAQEAEIARLTGVLQSIGAAPAPLALIHPDGPLGTARAGMILSDVVPALEGRARVLRADLTELAEIEDLQRTAAATLSGGLDAAQQARADLSAALTARTDLPRRFVENEVATAILAASTETLQGFAQGLAATVDEVLGTPPPDARGRRGDLPLPVLGTVLRRAGEADASGRVRDGVIVATRPRALVTAPAASTVRYAGPLLDLGLVTILEPAPDVLIVLAGLGATFGEVGEVVPEGAPVGMMGGPELDAQGILNGSGGADASQTLYIETREAGAAVDPALWLDLP